MYGWVFYVSSTLPSRGGASTCLGLPYYWPKMTKVGMLTYYAEGALSLGGSATPLHIAQMHSAVCLSDEWLPTLVHIVVCCLKLSILSSVRLHNYAEAVELVRGMSVHTLHVLCMVGYRTKFAIEESHADRQRQTDRRAILYIEIDCIK